MDIINHDLRCFDTIAGLNIKQKAEKFLKEQIMELFDKKYVHFIWDNELEGKKVITAETIDSLISLVNRDHCSTSIVREYTDSDCPFYEIESHRIYRFAYYDPNYEVKKAYAEGKQVQYKFKDEEKWYDINSADKEDIKIKGMSWFNDDYEYRIKPEELKTKRMTYRQLDEWLAKGNGQYCISTLEDKCYAYTTVTHLVAIDDEEVPEDYKIRKWGSDVWIEPTADVYFNDCFDCKEKEQ